LKSQNYLKMTEKSIVNSNKPDFQQTIPNYSDEEILKILKKRKQYQPEAAEQAIKEAIKRGLIHSEQDLFADEFKEKPTKVLLFPKIKKEQNRNDIRKSIARVLLLVGAAPAIWGVFKIVESSFAEGVVLILLGGIWMYASAQIMRAFNTKMINLLFLMLSASVVYLVKLFFGMKNLVLMDFVIPVVLFLFIVYGLLFIRKLQD
jgi:hypothetical protein